MIRTVCPSFHRFPEAPRTAYPFTGFFFPHFQPLTFPSLSSIILSKRLIPMSRNDTRKEGTEWSGKAFGPGWDFCW